MAARPTICVREKGAFDTVDVSARGDPSVPSCRRADLTRADVAKPICVSAGRCRGLASRPSGRRAAVGMPRALSRAAIPLYECAPLREFRRSLAPASSHYLDRDEHKAIGDLWRANAAKGIEFGYVFVNERDQPFGRMGVGRIIELLVRLPG